MYDCVGTANMGDTLQNPKNRNRKLTGDHKIPKIGLKIGLSTRRGVGWGTESNHTGPRRGSVVSARFQCCGGLQDLKEQVRDLMVYLEASQMAGTSELAGGSAEVGPAPKPRRKRESKR